MHLIIIWDMCALMLIVCRIPCDIFVLLIRFSAGIDSAIKAQNIIKNRYRYGNYGELFYEKYTCAYE